MNRFDIQTVRPSAGWSKIYRCPNCKNAIEIFCDGLLKEHICNYCGHETSLVDGVPFFLPDKVVSQDASGIAEKTFNSPKLYELLVRVKTAIWRDKTIGIKEFIKDKSVLDVGCGPSLHKPHLEYFPEDAKSMGGVDVSLPFILNARRENPGDKFTFAVAPIDNLPFLDKSYDTIVVSFVIHHIPGDLSKVFQELKRVARHHIVIFDHVRSDTAIVGGLQSLYWKIMDGGCNYLTQAEWDHFLSSFRIEKKIQTGMIFRHVVKYVCRVE